MVANVSLFMYVVYYDSYVSDILLEFLFGQCKLLREFVFEFFPLFLSDFYLAFDAVGFLFNFPFLLQKVLSAWYNILLKDL